MITHFNLEKFKSHLSFLIFIFMLVLLICILFCPWKLINMWYVSLKISYIHKINFCYVHSIAFLHLLHDFLHTPSELSFSLSHSLLFEPHLLIQKLPCINHQLPSAPQLGVGAPVPISPSCWIVYWLVLAQAVTIVVSS